MPPGTPSAAGAEARVSLSTGVETRRSPRGGTTNSWMTVPTRPLRGSRTTILAW